VKSKNEESALRIFFNRALHKDKQMRLKTIEEFEHELFRIHFVEEPLSSPSLAPSLFPDAFVRRLKDAEQRWRHLSQSFKVTSSITTAVDPILKVPERRRHPRVLVHNPPARAEVVDATKRVRTEANVTEVSRGGMLVRWAGLIPQKGKDYLISLHLGTGYRPIDGTAKLVYEISIDERTFVGFQFQKISDFDVKALEHYVRDRMTETPSKKPEVTHGTKEHFLDVYFNSSKEFAKEYEQNLKHGGLYTESDQDLEQGDRVWVRIHLPNMLLSVTLKATVVHIKPSDGKKGVALQLDESSEPLRQLAEDVSHTP
jgi:Tfp pilus assembly protein PilZ